MKDVYITSVAELLLDGSDADTIITNLIRVLKIRGHEKLFPKIIKGVKLELEGKLDDMVPEIILREKTDLAAHKEHIKKALTDLGTEADPAIYEDVSIIGGFTATYNHKRVDKSYKHALMKMYRKVTN